MIFKSKHGKINVREIGESTITPRDELIKGTYAHQHTVQIIFDGERAQFQYTSSIADYQAGKDKLSDENLMYALSGFLEDGISGNEEFENFCNELGYEVWADDPDKADRATGYDKKSLKVYKLCEKARAQAERIGITLDMAYDIVNELREAGYE
ncbi:hypothetical protein KAU33_15705 [Candidatus Dependentiae bacterium]|nr:hypothetical protein [Candidatus Dependentiae bacterium]